MTRRFVSSIVVALSLCALLFVATAVFAAGTTQAGPVSAAQGQSNAEKGQGGAERAEGTWSDVAPFPTISVTEWYPCSPAPCTPTGVNVSARIKRAGAAGYHPNGKLYMMGGRHGLDGQEDYPLRWIWEYDPTANTWTRKTALLEGTQSRDRFVANMAVATLTDTTGVRVYAIGGTNVDSVPSNLVRSYDPVADILTQQTGDAWPATPARLPGGWAVHDNKLYIFGGFSSIANGGLGAVFTDTWRFDPMAATGSKWTQLDSMNLGRGYIGGAAVNGKLYAVGGDTWDTVTRTLSPVPNVEMLDLTQPSPVWVNVAPLPDSRGDLGAWGYDSGSPYEIAGKVMVAGGNYPVPSANAYLYDTASNTWTTAPAMVHATRNFARAQLNGYLYGFGGYDYTDNTPNGANWNQRYDATSGGSTATPTGTGTPPTSTPTSISTNTATATSTSPVPAGCNPASITIPDSGPGVPYPSNINYSSGGSVTDVNVTLNDVNHTYPDDVDILLVGPAGQSVILMSDAGGSNDVTDVDLTFDDEATATLPDSAQIVAGSYDPTNYLTGDTFPAPAPGGPYGTTMSVFDGTNPNGNWSLYVVDDLGGDEGQIAGGWCLTLTTSGGATNTPTNTPQPPTSTATATEPAIPTSTVTSTSTPIPPCTIEFADVPPTHTFYPFVHCLACQGIISGYPCGGTGEPCNANNDPYYRPDNPVTRGQIAKIMSESAGFSEPVPSTQQSFEDVPYGSTFWEYIERLYTRSVIGGYQCGINPAEPCIPPDNRPYFRPNAGATRGQLVKIASESAGFTDVIPPGQYSFTDVEPGHTFWIYIERLLLNRPGAIAGYPCGGPGEPCDSENRPYFRPNNGVTRGQASKIVANTFFPACTPGRP
jgi:subtilisin-like proprotein convertase family protein